MKVIYMTEMGQLMDLITAPQNKADLSKFSLDRHVLSTSFPSSITKLDEPFTDIASL